MAVIIILWMKNKDQAFSWFSESYYSSTEFFEYPLTYLLTYLLSTYLVMSSRQSVKFLSYILKKISLKNLMSAQKLFDHQSLDLIYCVENYVVVMFSYTSHDK